jgi:hypothetical protein
LALNIQFDIEERKLAFRHSGLAQEQNYLRHAQLAADVEPARQTERMLEIVRFATAIAGAGFEVTVGPYEYQHFTFNCSQKDLPKVYGAVGHVEVICKTVENARRRQLNVYLQPTAFPDYCRIKYIKKLDKGARPDGRRRGPEGRPEVPAGAEADAGQDGVCVGVLDVSKLGDSNEGATR